MRVYKNFINNDLVGAISGKTFPVDNPATGEVFAEVPRSGTIDMDAAVVSAGSAFNGWRLTDLGAEGYTHWMPPGKDRLVVSLRF